MALPQHYTADFLPIIKYDARAGKFRRVHRQQDSSGNYTSSEVDLPLPVIFLMDFSSLEIGWMNFSSGTPDLQLVHWTLEEQLGKVDPDIPEQPTADHRMGFRLLVKTVEGEIRHFGHSSATVYRAFSGLHDGFLACPQAADRNLSPVVRVAEILPVKGRQGVTNYEPVFAIVKWADRPFDFDEHQPAAEVPATSNPGFASPGNEAPLPSDEELPF